jgi:SMI1 / KNR4 family (SUKH-1)
MELLFDRIERIRRKVLDRALVLGPPVPEAQLWAFERANGITLPAEFRKFLLTIGNGGDGPPHYGLQPLSRTLQDEVGVPVTPALPFPLTEFWVWDAEEVMTEELEKLQSAVWHQGYLFLGTDGCAKHWVLIVTGSSRGQVWNLTDCGAQPCAPTRDYLSWYEFWLDGGEDYFSEFVWPHGKPTPRP